MVIGNTESRQCKKIAFVAVGADLNNIGFRRVAAIARKIEPNTDVFFIAVTNGRSLMNYISSKSLSFSVDDIEIVGRRLADYDIVGISSMSNVSEYVAQIAVNIKKNNRNSFILYGGVHATLYPDNAIQNVDAVCVGEGEKPLMEFLTVIKNNRGGGGVYTNQRPMV